MSPSLPSEVTDVGTTLATALNAAATALRLVRIELVTATALTATAGGALDAARTAVAVLETAVTSAINALLDDTGGYILLIPLPKQGLRAALDAPSDVPTNAPGGLQAAVPAATLSGATWLQAFDPVNYTGGGNAHILRTIAASVVDPADPNRPHFTRDTYWGYALLVAGGTDLGVALGVAAYFDRLFGALGGAGQVGAGRGWSDVAVRGLRATASARGNYVVLGWDPPDTRSLDDGTWRAVPERYAVIRSERVEAASARKVLDLFTTRGLTAGATGRYGARVLAVEDYDGLAGRYVDTTARTADTTYYYHVAVDVRVDRVDGAEGSFTTGFDLLSSPVRWRDEPRRPTDTRGGVAPDWLRSPSIARLVPALDRLLDRVVEIGRDATSAAERSLDLGDAALAALDAQVARLAAVAGDLATLLGQLGQVFASPAAGVHIASRTGRGSVGAFVSDVAAALDEDDPDRPPFDGGDEYTCGAVVLVAAPDLAAFERAWVLLQLLFGPPAATDPVVAGVQAIADAVAATAPDLTEPTPTVTFDEAMNPRPGRGNVECDP